MRGDPRTPGDEVPRRFLQILGGQPLPADGKGSGRLQLADWLTDPKNPLTARVMVNRIWQHHFGEGLVRDAEQLRQAGPAADAPGIARLSRRPVRALRLVGQGDAPADHAVARPIS